MRGVTGEALDILSLIMAEKNGEDSESHRIQLGQKFIQRVANEASSFALPHKISSHCWHPDRNRCALTRAQLNSVVDMYANNTLTIVNAIDSSPHTETTEVSRPAMVDMLKDSASDDDQIDDYVSTLLDLDDFYSKDAPYEDYGRFPQNISRLLIL